MTFDPYAVQSVFLALQSSDLAHAIWWVAEIFPDIVGVAGANMQWSRFVCPSCSQKKENTAFESVLRSAWGLSSPCKQVGRSSTPCRKRSQVWGRESEWWPKYAAETPVLEMGRILKNKLSPLRVKTHEIIIIITIIQM